jgi:hypothetical protein
MVFDTSYFDRNIKEQIDELVGNPFGLLDRLKMNGIGCGRLRVHQVSPDIQVKIPTDLSDFFVSFELRPKGVILHFKKYTEHFSWAIPYYRLTIYQSRMLSIYEGNTFMKFRLLDLHKTHQTFFRKLISSKTAFMDNYSLLPI